MANRNLEKYYSRRGVPLFDGTPGLPIIDDPYPYVNVTSTDSYGIDLAQAQSGYLTHIKPTPPVQVVEMDTVLGIMKGLGYGVKPVVYCKHCGVWQVSVVPHCPSCGAPLEYDNG